MPRPAPKPRRIRRPAATPRPRPRLSRPRALPTPAPVPATYTRDELLSRFAPLVRHVVERVAATLPRNVDHEDLYSAGVLGLLDAHAKFDARKGVKFETYAVWRIKGAVLDQLRALDWASRSMRRKARNLDGVTRKLDQKLGRAASEDEVARELKMTRNDFYRLLDHVRGAVLVSLDEARTNDGEGGRRRTAGAAAARTARGLVDASTRMERAPGGRARRTSRDQQRAGWDSWQCPTAAHEPRGAGSRHPRATGGRTP